MLWNFIKKRRKKQDINLPITNPKTKKNWNLYKVTNERNYSNTHTHIYINLIHATPANKQKILKLFELNLLFVQKVEKRQKRRQKGWNTGQKVLSRIEREKQKEKVSDTDRQRQSNEVSTTCVHTRR